MYDWTKYAGVHKLNNYGTSSQVSDYMMAEFNYAIGMQYDGEIFTLKKYLTKLKNGKHSKEMSAKISLEIDKIFLNNSPNKMNLVINNNVNGFHKLFISQHNVIDISHHTNNKAFNFVGTFSDKRSYEEINKFIDDTFKETGSSDIYVLVADGGGIQSINIGEVYSEFKKENYVTSVVSDYEYVLKSFVEKDPFGRLIILHGEPGTGKTHLVKSLLCNLSMECTTICIDASVINGNAMSSLLKVLIDLKFNKPIILIIEDADNCLVPRGADNMSSISNLLNLADGIIGSILDIRIIATSNSREVDMDRALLRPGRLCKQIEIGRLEAKQAELVYKSICGKERQFDLPMTLAEVYEAAHGLGIKDIKKKSVGFAK